MSENRERPHWEGKQYSFFQNTECEYFPCHRIADPTRFSCLFCYCPLYMLGPHCGGNFRYTEKGIKDCTGCLIPHLPENYGRITGKYKEIAAAMQQAEASQAKKNDGCPNAAAKRGDCRTNPAEKKEVHQQKAFLKTGRSQDLHGRRTMERIVMLACTERGFETMRGAASALKKHLPDTEILQTGRCAFVPGFENGPKLSEATAEWFHEADALIFIAAAGIAVRCIAPFVQDKFRDPAVLVMDENGKFVIPLMSGHAGGANHLCGLLAEAAGAQPVITTATDGRGLFAVDVFAAENGLQISDRVLAKQTSARILAGEILKIYFDEALESPAGTGTVRHSMTGMCGKKESPAGTGTARHSMTGMCGKEESPAGTGTSLAGYGKGICGSGDRSNADIIVSFRHAESDRKDTLYLIPQAVTLGIGCRKGTTPESIEKAVQQILRTCGVFPQAVSGIASIDLKKEEAGLHAFAEKWNLPLSFYTAEELSQVPGAFSSSDFVRNVTGVDCVCERSAVRLAMDHTGDTNAADHTGAEFGKEALLLERKTSLEGVTAALAFRPYILK